MLDTLVQADAANRPQPSCSLLIEGWRGVNHSFALVNQHQILELLKIDGLRLFHRDLPFALAHWTRSANTAGFSTESQTRIDALTEPCGKPVDCVYRICSPIRPGADSDRRTLTFMVTELGLSPSSFVPGAAASAFYTQGDNLIVTTTAWSRARIVEHGFAPDRVRVVPHGVDTAVFHPCTAAERQLSRGNLGIAPDETVFLNVGVALWNKGIDLVLAAFARLRSAGRRVRLILKDQRDVYGLSVEQTIRDVGQLHPALFAADTLAAISVVPGNLSQDQLRLLYGVADCYVSPYRGEGFNLPVLEAIACGTPAVVTAGGATDDFCDGAVSCQIPGRPGERPDPATGARYRFIEPDLAALTEAMDGFATGHGLDPAGFAAGRARVVRDFHWRRAARALADLCMESA